MKKQNNLTDRANLTDLARKGVKALAGVLLMVSLLAMLAAPVQAQVTATRSVAFTNLPALVLGQASSNQTSIAVVKQGRGMSLSALVGVTNAASSYTNLVLYFSPATDSTNGSYASVTGGSLVWTIALANASNGWFRAWTNIPASVLDNVGSLCLTQVTATASSSNWVFLTNVIWQVSP